MNVTGASPGARFSFSPRIRWSFSSSTSVIPSALSFLTVKVTGPAGTEFVSGVQASVPLWLTKVMFTVLIPP